MKKVKKIGLVVASLSFKMDKMNFLKEVFKMFISYSFTFQNFLKLLFEVYLIHLKNLMMQW